MYESALSDDRVARLIEFHAPVVSLKDRRPAPAASAEGVAEVGEAAATDVARTLRLLVADA